MKAPGWAARLQRVRLVGTLPQDGQHPSVRVAVDGQESLLQER
jgi:hypothetical protein